ncbi:hypothetical protein GVX82_03115 [Patescibacteria group bacterium]|jgi:spoIIIJ-associated protein|nr:hypothetical protein [Patescibacteria group bacterium]
MEIDTNEVIEVTREVVGRLPVELQDVTYVADALHPIISVKVGNAKRLIGARGEHLRALNTLVKRIMEQRTGVEHANFLIDVNHYQQERNEEVRRKAKVIIERVRSFRSSAQLDPLSAYERMLVHSMVADDPEIVTESSGEGKDRRLTVRFVERPAEVPDTFSEPPLV